MGYQIKYVALKIMVYKYQNHIDCFGSMSKTMVYNKQPLPCNGLSDQKISKYVKKILYGFVIVCKQLGHFLKA